MDLLSAIKDGSMVSNGDTTFLISLLMLSFCLEINSVATYAVRCKLGLGQEQRSELKWSVEN